MDDWKFKPATDLGMPPTERHKSLYRESGLISTALHQAWWLTIRGYFNIWHRLSIEGYERIPTKPPFVLVANHTSHLDALVLASPLNWRIRDRIFPIAAGDVFFETPMISTFAALFLNALPIWRKNCGAHALERLRERLVEEPCAYILFPEGARSRDGSMAKFKPGLGMLVAETNVPVIPCHLDGCFEALRPGRKIPSPSKIHLRVGEPLEFSAVTNNREGWIRITHEIQASVERLIPAQTLSASGVGGALPKAEASEVRAIDPH
jgi:1-acyl-sn-glycerol-3-phosphate acyltransferase